MLEVLKKYSGIIFFYLVIVGIVLLISTNDNKFEEKEVITYAISE